MIKLNKVNKYYNKNKNNQIHVINDFDYEFPSKGLVCLFGPSGCGKTSLLNAISGLDGINSGEIIIDDQKFTKKYRADKWDSIRSKDIGYVFQSYVLFNDLTVYENLRFVLDVFGLEEEEIQTRIDYALNAVGMIKYKNRECNHLSGGQQQRVAIARALVKSPKIIVADEPTGNLDEKNTNIILNIIKKISKECLVVLVTHEDRIAKFYADTIIYLKDGKIDFIEENSNSNQLNLIDDKNIYLQELNSEKITNGNVNVEYFYQENENQVRLKIVSIDNNIYVFNENKKQKINLLSRDSETKLIDSKKPIITMDEVDKFEYELESITTNKHNPAISFKKSFIIAWNFIMQMGRKQKMLIALMILSSILVVVSFSSLTKSNYVDEKDYLNISRDSVLVVSNTNRSYSELKGLTTKDIYPAFSRTPYWQRSSAKKLYFDEFEQMAEKSYFLSDTQLLPVESYNDITLLHGRLPNVNDEITLDKWTLDLLINSDSEIYLSGYSGNYQDFIGKKINTFVNKNFKIVGITNVKSPVMFTTLEDYNISFLKMLNTDGFYYTTDDSYNGYQEGINIYFNYNMEQINYNSDALVTLESEEEVKIKDLNLTNNEIIVSEEVYRRLVEYGEGKSIKFFGNDDSVSYNVKGYISYENSKQDYNTIFINKEISQDLVNEFIDITNMFTIISKNTNELESQAESLNIDVNLGKNILYQNYLNANQKDFSSIIFNLLILVSSLIFLYFIIRTNMISRIYDIGVYRALGVKKRNVYKIFFVQTIVLTTISSFVGWVGTSIFILKINESSPLFFYPWFVAFGSLVFIYLINIIVGMLPIINLLRNKPVEILNKYDI